jgi:hypothetical protein
VIAAEKRASQLLRLLHDEGVDEKQLARVHAPAGLDLGPVANAAWLSHSTITEYLDRANSVLLRRNLLLSFW